jgi:hypothetical protein
MLGLDVYRTFYVPDWVLGVAAMAIVLMPALAILTSRRHVGRMQRREAGT